MDSKKKLILYGLTAVGVVLVVLVVVFVISMFTGTSSYSNVENTMKKAAQKYFTEERLPANGQTASINVATLVAEEYMKSLEKMTKDSSCEGSVSVYNNNGQYQYFPILKCADYQSSTLESMILKDLVETGSGLYTTDVGYLYKGEKINNYVLFADQLWRIIRMDDTGVRLISLESTGKSVRWDNRYNVETGNYNGINDYRVSRIRETLESYYYNEKVFTQKDREHMILHDVCIGKRHGDDARIALMELDCADILADQVISLLSVSEYSMASLDEHCNSIADGACSNYNFFHDVLEETWTVTGFSNASNMAFYTNSIGVYSKKTNASTKYHPVIYLHKQEVIHSGDGSLEKPYVIK